MKTEVAEGIANASQDIGLCLESRSYSGRGMYGKSTHAISCLSIGEFLTAAVFYASTLPDDDDSPLEDLLEDLRKIRADSMGMGIVVY